MVSQPFDTARVIEMYRANTITVQEAQQRLDKIAEEKAGLEAEVAKLDARAALA